MKLYLPIMLAGLVFNSYGAAQNANKAHQMFKVPEILINIASKCFYIEDLDAMVGKMVTATPDLKYYIYSDGLKIFSSYLEYKFGEEFDSARFLHEVCNTKSDSYLKYIEPIMYIIKHKDLKALQALLIYCVFKNDLNLVPEFLRSKQYNNNYIPSEYNPIDIVRAIKMGVDIEANEKQLDFLFKIGFINFYIDSETVFCAAYPDTDLMEYILAKGFDFKGENSPNFMDAYSTGDVAATKLFIDAGVDCTNPSLEGASELNTKIVELFLDKIGIEKIDEFGDWHFNLLMKASNSGEDEIVELLLDHGSNVNIDGMYGTALMCASRSGHENMVDMLLGANCDINFQHNYEYSEDEGDSEFEEFGFESLTIAKGDTALIAACRSGQINIVELLIERGADLNIQNCNGDTALTLARKNSLTDIVNLLSDAGAQ